MAQEVGEEILGSAPQNTDFWLLVESRSPFSPKVVKESPLADLLRPLMDHLSRTIPSSRVQFIRRPRGQDSGAGLQVFVADSRLPSPRLYGATVNSHEDLSNIDIASIREGRLPEGFIEHKEPLILICTHGKRDRCCAVHGRAFLKAVTEDNKRYVWESSHIGGHRFAATCVTLPLGHYFGRLQASDANLLIEQCLRGLLYDLRSFRGSAPLSKLAQIVEGRIRQSHGILETDALEYMGESASGLHTFTQRATKREFRARVKTFERDELRLKSCNAAPEPFQEHQIQWVE
jgi:hypothetical protein